MRCRPIELKSSRKSSCVLIEIPYSGGVGIDCFCTLPAKAILERGSPLLFVLDIAATPFKIALMPIQDEFSDLPISRQAKQQKRHLRDGKCKLCNQPLFNANYCLKHAIKSREGDARRMGRKKETNCASRRAEPLADALAPKFFNSNPF